MTVRVQDQGGLFVTQPYNVTVAPPKAAVVGFTLRDADLNVVIGPLANGAIIDLTDLCGGCQVNFEAIVTDPTTGATRSVAFALSGATTRNQNNNNVPYTMPGTNGTDFLGMNLNPGPHSLTATPFSGLNVTGMAGIPLTVNFVVAGPPVIISQPVTTAMVAEPYAYDVEATTLTGAPLTYGLVTFPAGMTIDATSGLISWTPASNQTGNRNVRVRVTDRMNRTTDQVFTIVVASGTPVITTNPVTAATVGDLYTYDVNATAALPTGDPLTYSLTTLPAGMSINASTGVITWTPVLAQVGNRNVTVRVTDAKGRFQTQSYTIAVSAKAETITVTQAVFHNIPGSTTSDFWTISGTSTVMPSSCTGTPNVCGNLTIRRTNGNPVIGIVTVDGSGNWTLTTVPPGAVQAVAGNTIRVLSETGGVINNVPITIQTN